MRAAILIGALIVASLLAGCGPTNYTCWDGSYAGTDAMYCNDRGGIQYEHTPVSNDGER